MHLAGRLHTSRATRCVNETCHKRQISDARLTSVSFLATTIACTSSHPPASAVRGTKSPSMQPHPETTLSRHRDETFQQDGAHPHWVSINFVVDFWLIYWCHAMLDICHSVGDWSLIQFSVLLLEEDLLTVTVT